MVITTLAADVHADSDDLVSDGALITIRPLRPEDRSGVLDLCATTASDPLARLAGTVAANVTTTTIDGLCPLCSDDRLTVTRPVPLTDLDAGRMWHRLSCASAGVTPSVNSAEIEDLALRLSALADDQPEIALLDLAPVLAGPNGVVATHARLRRGAPRTANT